MKQFSVILQSFADIRDFVALAILQPFEVSVCCGSATANAKSLMAMFSLSYRQPLQVHAVCDDAAFEAFTAAAAKFLA